jgi:hypothetical protein
MARAWLDGLVVPTEKETVFLVQQAMMLLLSIELPTLVG